jgi:hypothetical protein
VATFDAKFIDRRMKDFNARLNNQRIQSLRTLCIGRLDNCHNPICEVAMVEILERLNEIEAESGGQK